MLLSSSKDPSQLLDTVIVREIRLEATVGPDRWAKVRDQPILVSVFAHTSLAAAGQSDDVRDSIHYGDLGKEIIGKVGGATFPSLYDLAEVVAWITLARGANSVEVEAEALNQFLSARCLSVSVARDSKVELPRRIKTSIKDILLHIIIGVNPPERIHKQEILMNIDFWTTSPVKLGVDWGQTYQELSKVVESTQYQTLEAFATRVAAVALEFGIAETVTVTAQKPKALSYAHSSGVQITRSKAQSS